MTSVVAASHTAPPVVMPPVVAAQAMPPRTSARPRFVAATALGLLLVAGGALAWSNREPARPVLADAGVVQPALADENAGAAFMSNPAEQAPSIGEDQAVEVAEVAPVATPRLDAQAHDDVVALEDTASAPGDTGDSDEIVVAEATSPSVPEARELNSPSVVDALALPAEDSVVDEALVVAESTPPPRVEERAAVVTEEQPARQVRQVGENLATEWPASGTGSPPPRIAAPSSGDTPPDETASAAPAVPTRDEVAELTGAAPEAEAVEAEASPEIPAVAAIEVAPPVLDTGGEPGSETVVVTLPPGHFELSGAAAVAADGVTPQLAELSPLAPAADETGMRTPRPRPQPTMAAYQQVPPAEPARTRPRRVFVAEVLRGAARPPASADLWTAARGLPAAAAECRLRAGARRRLRHHPAGSGALFPPAAGPRLCRAGAAPAAALRDHRPRAGLVNPATPAAAPPVSRRPAVRRDARSSRRPPSAATPLTNTLSMPAESCFGSVVGGAVDDRLRVEDHEVGGVALASRPRPVEPKRFADRPVILCTAVSSGNRPSSRE